MGASAALQELQALVVEAANRLNAGVALAYPVGTRLSARHAGSPMQCTVIRHPAGVYHAGELLVKSRSGQRQWITLDRILEVLPPEAATS